ncbi:MAG: alpha/beta hydrolase-fold protein [Phormidesmis sp.]
MTVSTVSIPDTEVHPLHSEFVGDDFELWIAKPQAGFVPASKPPTVLYVLDANLCFGTAVEMTRIMHKLYGELPPMLVVGIAYPTADSFLQGVLRTRDFTPSSDNSLADRVAELPAVPQTVKVEPAMGGANNFLQFLQEEVKPFIASRFEISPENSTIFGSSLGGLFAAYTLFTAPDTFDNFIIVSPSLWWDKEWIFELEASQAMRICALASSVFLAVGELEETSEIPMLAEFKSVTNVRKLADLLTKRNDYSLKVMLDVLAGETHTSVIPVALTRGLRNCLR